MAQKLSEKKLKKGVKLGEKIDEIKDFAVPTEDVKMIFKLDKDESYKTLFNEDQKARVAKIRPVWAEFDPAVAKFENLQQDLWPEKDLLLYECATQAYWDVLRKKSLEVNSGTKERRKRLIWQCFGYFCMDEVNCCDDVDASCCNIYRARKDEILEAIRRARAITALCEFCASCRRPNVDLLLCGRCKAARYCNKGCQLKDWKHGKHKVLCEAVQAGFVKVENIPRLKYKDAVPMHARQALIPAFLSSTGLFLDGDLDRPYIGGT